MGRKPAVLSLTSEERQYLEIKAKARTIQAQIMTRARILLLKADGYTIEEIADKVGLNRKSVILCLEKYKAGGVENALMDAPGRGRNPEITKAEREWIVALAKRDPSEFGYPVKKWSYARLTEHIHKVAEDVGYLRLSTVHKTTVNTILDDAGVKLHSLKYDEHGNAI